MAEATTKKKRTGRMPAAILAKVRQVAELAAEKKARDIRAFDVRGLTLMADAFVLCSVVSQLVIGGSGNWMPALSSGPELKSVVGRAFWRGGGIRARGLRSPPARRARHSELRARSGAPGRTWSGNSLSPGQDTQDHRRWREFDTRKGTQQSSILPASADAAGF